MFSTAQRDGSAPGEQGDRLARRSGRLASVGLLVLQVVLTVFAMSVAVINERATDKAQRSGGVAAVYEQTQEALLVQLEAADTMASTPLIGDRQEYDNARLTVRAYLQDLAVLENGTHAADVGELSLRHDQYGEQVEDSLTVPAGASLRAEAHEELYIDPYSDKLQELLEKESSEHLEESATALDAVARRQDVTYLATPALFGAGLVLWAAFHILLHRERRRTEQQAVTNRFQATHDSLTGLPNRALLHQRTAAALTQSCGATPGALLLLDLDRFKDINDTLGHHHGDQLLQEVARQLRDAVPDDATVARLGGDEFAILLPAAGDMATAISVAEDVQAALAGSLDVDGVLLNVDVSIGIALFGTHGTSSQTLMQHADIAMYWAKTRSLGVCGYDKDFDSKSGERLVLLGELQGAMDNGQLFLHYQPKIELPGRAFVGVEALLRWQHPDRGVIPPDTFVPAAEQTALIRPLTRYVLDAALAECRRWLDNGRQLNVAVNVSARNLLDNNFPSEVRVALCRWRVPAASLTLEVTESAIMLDPAQSQAILARIRGMGITVSVDDFGSGYTSIGHLRRLPVDELKLDRSLVAKMSSDTGDATIVRAVIDLAHDLGLRTVAEGIEDETTLERLSLLGCDSVQGYHIGRPMPAAELQAWVDVFEAVARTRSVGGAPLLTRAAMDPR